MGHNVGKAADNAVKRSAKTVLDERTPEQRIKAARANLAANLFVPPDEQRFLLDRYDVLVESLRVSEGCLVESHNTIKKLQDENEQFRVVYELENRSTSIKVGKFDEILENAVVSTVTVDGSPLTEDLTGVVAQAISDSQ